MPRENIVPLIRQSAPIDTSRPIPTAALAGRAIAITGGASGIGARFARHWAAHGARLVIGDVRDEAGAALVAELRAVTAGDDDDEEPRHHYRRCDVTDWASQAAFFADAARLTGGLDAVVANAGLADTDGGFCGVRGGAMATGLGGGPVRPDLACLDVNVRGVAYTAHLAMYYLARNGGPGVSSGGGGDEGGGAKKRRTRAAAAAAAAAADGDDAPPPPFPRRDRHLLLVGSVASLWPQAQGPAYTMGKHAVLGLFRALRGTAAWTAGVRVNLLCPYATRTPLLSPLARIALAGGAVGAVDSVVEAGTRLMADADIVGRSLVVGPRVRVRDDDPWDVAEVLEDDDGGEDEDGDDDDKSDARVVSSWEAYAHDYELVEVCNARIVRLLNQVEYMRGWTGWARDVVGALGVMVGLVKA